MCNFSAEKIEETDVNLISFHLKPNVMLTLSMSGTGDMILERLDI